MTTVIDSLVIELGLDSKNFTKGQLEALDSFKKTQEEAVKGGKAVEEQSKKSMDALGGIRTQALELFAVFTGGKGLVDFTAHTITTNSQLGRLSRNLGISAEVLNKWQGAARIFGGDGAQMAQTFTSISDAVAGFKIGQISPLIADFRALSSAGGTVIDINKGVDQTLLDISANLAKINAEDPARAGLLGRMIGLDSGLYDLLVKGPKATQEMLDKVNGLGPATKAATDAAGDLERRWNSIGVKADAFGRAVLNSGVGSRVGALADELNKPLSEAKPWDALFGTGAYAPGARSSAPSGGGAFGSQTEKEAFIRSEAVRRGIDPNVAMAVARSEGFNNPVGDNGTSFGAFQLHLTPGGRGNAVGDQFGKSTGLDVRDPANERAAIQFALDDVKAHGWGAYHGAARSGVGAWAGIGGGSNSTTTTSIAVNGPITIQAGPNADGGAIANKFTDTLKRQSYAAQANDGQN